MTTPHASKTSSSEENDGNMSPDEVESLRVSMENLDCPFTWKPIHEYTGHKFIHKLEAKMEETAEDDELILPWPTLYSNLTLCYEYFCKNCVSEAESKLIRLEDCIDQDKKDIPLNALKHIILSCKCFLWFEQKKYVNVRAALEEIVAYKDMDSVNQACILGLRAGVWMEYACEGDKQSLIYSQKAMKLNPHEGEWAFLRAIALGRIRRIEKPLDMPDEEEIIYLKKANKLCECVPYMLFLAQVYREKSTKLWENNKDEFYKVQGTCDNLNSKVSGLYKNALDLRKDCPRVNIRCAQGFLMLPYSDGDMRLALECIQKALELAPDNVMAHHVAGKYYVKKGCVEKARDHLQIAGVVAFGASSDLIKLNWRNESYYDPCNWWIVPKYDILSQFEELLERYTDTAHRHMILCQIGSYWYFIQGNFKEALKYWTEVHDEDPSSFHLLEHKPLLLQIKSTINILEIMFHEASAMLKSESTSPEDREVMEKLVQDLSQGYYQIWPQSPREKILNSIKNTIEKKTVKENKRQESNWRKTSGSSRTNQTEGDNFKEKQNSARNNGSEVSGQIQQANNQRRHGREKIDWRNSACNNQTEFVRQLKRNTEKQEPRRRDLNWRNTSRNRELELVGQRKRNTEKQEPERQETSWRNTAGSGMKGDGR